MVLSGGKYFVIYSSHVEQVEAPATADSLPVGQAVQMAAPGVAAMEPGTQGMHASQPPGEKVPTGQAEHAPAAG